MAYLKQKESFFLWLFKNKFSKKNILEPKKQTYQMEYPTTWHLLEKKMDLYILFLKNQNTVFKNDNWQGKLGIDNLIARPLTASMENGTDLIKIIISVKSLFYRIKVILELKKSNL